MQINVKFYLCSINLIIKKYLIDNICILCYDEVNNKNKGAICVIVVKTNLI